MSFDSALRAEEVYNIRVQAAEIARQRKAEPAISNGEEESHATLIAAFTKGLCHNNIGTVVDVEHFHAFVNACNTGDMEEIARLPLGPTRDDDGQPEWRSKTAKSLGVGVRGWESMAAGLAYDLQGPDAQTFVMPPAPTLCSDELVAEMAELYLMALVRDLTITKWHEEDNELITFAIDELNKLPWFAQPSDCAASPAEAARRRGPVTRDNIFRGLLPGSLVGPYLSQFLIGGSDHLGASEGYNARTSGIVRYGAITINQRIRIAKPGIDFLTKMDYFLDVQDGADLRGREQYEDGERLIVTMRDLSTYVHYDALYEAYLNACLIMLANKVPYDPGLPFVGDDAQDKHQGFALYGAPHILTLVTEVATRALKAVRFSKFNVHRRARPEAVGGLIHMHKTKGCFPEVDKLVSELEPILQRVAEHNRNLNENEDSSDGSEDGDSGNSDCENDGVKDSYLLPMAFSEGSPVHPSYGSGHATVAGACVTVLKAFFDEDYVLENVYQVDEGGDSLVPSSDEAFSDCKLTVRSELEKLADNISIGRDVAGVHYFSDQWESLLLGEKIALGILEETRLTFREPFHFSLTKFNGDHVHI